MPKRTELRGAVQEPMTVEALPELGADQEYELVDIDQIEEHPENYNHGDVDLIAESIDENGWYGVVTVQRSTGYILAGNHRYRAAKQRGSRTVPVVWKDCDDVTAIRILIGDNEIARRATADKDQLARLLGELGSVRGTGFSGLEELEATERAEEEAQAAEEVAKAAEEPALYEPGDDTYTQQYGIIVVCADEGDQEAKYAELKKLEWNIRVVAV